MARLASAAGVRNVGAYAAVTRAHEGRIADLESRRFPVPPVIVERLRRLRRGETVWTPAHYLPEGIASLPPAGRPGLMALVLPDDGPMAFRPEESGEWLAENGLDS